MYSIQVNYLTQDCAGINSLVYNIYEQINVKYLIILYYKKNTKPCIACDQ